MVKAAHMNLYLVVSFYHAMLCIARTMQLKDVCPSVGLSVCHIRDSVETAKHAFKLFSTSEKGLLYPNFKFPPNCSNCRY